MKQTTIRMLETLWLGMFTTLLGSWDRALEILLVIVTLDYVTGVAVAFKRKTVSSSQGYIGIMKKVSIFIIVILAAQIDHMTSGSNNLFRNCTAFFFAANDALSVLENVGEFGINIPSFLRNAFIELRDSNKPKSDDKNNREP